MPGILAIGAHLPHRRLDRSTIAAVAGGGGGKGTRTVAGYDEDATTLAVEAGRALLRSTPARPTTLWFATTTPTYADKANATAVHAALRLDDDVLAADAVGSARSSIAALIAALRSPARTLVVTGDVRPGLPGSPDEAAGADMLRKLMFVAVDTGQDRVDPFPAEIANGRNRRHVHPPSSVQRSPS